MGSKSSTLLNGDHTRTVVQASSAVGSLMKFAVKTAQCLGCRTPLKDSKQAVCNNCEPRLGEIYHAKLTQASAFEVEFARLWVCCQRCQSSLASDVICTNRDCQIFFKRKRAQKDVEEAVKNLARFDLTW